MKARLRRGGPPSSVLFVCHGNICRSPYAAESFRRHLPPALRSRIRVTSAGFIGPDRASPPEALAAARRLSVDLAAHRSRLLTADDAACADWIVVMDARQRRWIRDLFGRNGARVMLLGDLDPEPTGPRSIQDPVNGAEAFFHRVYARIDRCAAELARVAAGTGDA